MAYHLRALRCLLGAAATMVAAFLCGCASLPPEGARSYTVALRADASPLGQIARASMDGAEKGTSGFRLVLGPSGLDLRLALIRSADRSLDLQYYHLHDDTTGRLVLRELRDAAKRGVRVRLLLDDLYTGGLETLLSGLGSFPNVEVRLFNPFPTRGSIAIRFVASAVDFKRLNRRMHNKLFIADGVMAVTGGRNLGDEYFMRGTRSNFFDYDALVMGAVLPQLSSIFDEYWNSEQVRTAASVLRQSASPDDLRELFDAEMNSDRSGDPTPFSGSDRLGKRPAIEELSAGRVAVTLGVAQAFADSPAKAQGDLQTARLPSGALLDSTRLLLAEKFRTAKREVRVSSPYVVPGPMTMQSVQLNRERGVRVALLTNSLAATDEPIVHTGYRRYRDNLLRAGVEIHELHPMLGQRLLLPGELSTSLRLHTKAAMIDAEDVFVGSVNFDPRSEALNTEFGIFIQSPELAQQVIGLFELLKRHASYEVRLESDSKRNVEWVTTDDHGAQTVLDSEPGADLWTRAKLYLQSLLISESML